MTDDPRQLFVVEFTATDQARLAGFSCGDQPWSKHIANWILGSDVLDSMSRHGTQVWLFETAQREIVGFGSLGTSNWKWPPPAGEKTTIVLLPMLGIDVRYHGQPPDLRWRHSHQIMRYLIAEARRITHDWAGQPDKQPQLVLLVHRDKARAIRFYQHCGFELITNVERRGGHVVMSLWIGD